jgi:pimeloyl-ACP methyl ester carboxylesterase
MMAVERFVDAGGVRARYLEEGSGPVVLLLHGASLGSSADVWARTMSDLAAIGMRAIAPDLPGFGLTDNPSDHSVGFRARFIPSFLDAIGVDRAHVVGHSQSGQVAVRLAIDEPARIGKIVVLGTASMLPPLPDSAAGDAAEGDEGGDSTEPTIHDVRRRLADTVFDHSKITHEAVALRHRMSTGKNFEAFLARRAAKSGDKKKDAKPLWQRLDEVTVPMRLIYGRQDRAAERRAALAKQRYPGLDVHLIDRCRHLIQWDAPSEVAALLADFLGREEPHRSGAAARE